MGNLVASRRRASGRSLGVTEERALLTRYQRDGDHEARAELVEALLPLVRQIAQSYSGKGEQVEDLIQVGSLGLLKAIERFDLDRGVRLSTFASPTISGEIKRHFRDRTWALRTPRDLQELYAALRQAERDFERSQGRSPTIAELCELTGRDEEAVLDALAAGRNFRTRSIDAPTAGEDLALADRIGSVDPGYDAAEARAVIAACADDLDERQRHILACHYTRGMTQREIAAQIGLSQMHVSRLFRQALETMRAAAT